LKVVCELNDANEKEKKFYRTPKSAKEEERRTGKTNQHYLPKNKSKL
jgi:hypothetical protein